MLNKCVVTKGRKKPFRIQFLVNKSKSMHYYEKFRQEIFCRKLNFEQICHLQGLGKTFQIQFLVNKSKSMHFYKKFFSEIFCRKLNCKQLCSYQGSEKSLVNSVFSLYIKITSAATAAAPSALKFASA